MSPSQCDAYARHLLDKYEYPQGVTAPPWERRSDYAPLWSLGPLWFTGDAQEACSEVRFVEGLTSGMTDLEAFERTVSVLI